MALTQQTILEKLHEIAAPGGRMSLVEAGAVRGIEVDGSSVKVVLAVEAPDPSVAGEVRSAVEGELAQIEGVENLEVTVHPLLATVQRGPGANPEPPPDWSDKIPGVKRVIAVASGKGGVGKSTVAANLSLALAKLGHAVGLLDGDIYGPSQQMMMGATDDPIGDAEGKIRPVTSPGGVDVMSFGFLVDPDQPVIWRGPMLQKALEQFIGDVEWGDLDYLIIDLPPGTGDVALTLCQNVPMAGVVIVTTPQDVALVDARKSLHMFKKLEVPVLGIVENMSAYTCPECGHVESIFGSGGGERTAKELGIPLLGSVPLDPAVVVGGDGGKPVVVDRPDSPTGKAFSELAQAVSELTS
ncbi:MAG: Mrp/NBP35 family ATP-binding protein [Acidobacteria bacterium]|jgi:ATP-binding protein involved in chromosome partitioning|nr:Mrp/NBP35 family ATP-binding protein [Acidobacteriota bacterium]